MYRHQNDVRNLRRRDPGFGGTKLARHGKAALSAEINVENYQLRSELSHQADRLRTRGRRPDHVESLAFEQKSRRSREVRVVVDDDAAQGHAPRMTNRRAPPHS